MSARPPVVRFPRVSGRAIALGMCALLAAASTFAADDGRPAAEDSDASVGDAAGLAGGVVVGVAPEWPFVGFFVPHLGRFWDTGRGRVHETGSQQHAWGYVSCHADVAVDESAVRVEHWHHAPSGTYGYVVPWGDLSYPVVDVRSARLGPFDASALGGEDAAAGVSGRGPELGADPGVLFTHAYSDWYAIGEEAAEDNDLYMREGRPVYRRYGNFVAFRLESVPRGRELDPLSLRRVWLGGGDDDLDVQSWRLGFDSRNYRDAEGGAGQWYLMQEGVRGFVESAPVVPGGMDPEVAFEAVTDYHPWVPYEFHVGATDGRYYGITQWSYSEASCGHRYRTFVVDGVSGEVAGCLEMPPTEIDMGRQLVFVAAPPEDRLERFALPSAAVPTGLDACGYRLDGAEPGGFPFAAVASGDGGS